jgi:site-specific recombinase XerC
MAKSIKLPTDSRGNYRSDVGWELKPSGTVAQHRFYFGTNENAALGSLARVRQVWDCVVAFCQRYGDKPLWNEQGLGLALSVARGEPVYYLPVDTTDEKMAMETLGIVRQIFPGFAIELQNDNGLQEIAEAAAALVVRSTDEVRQKLDYLDSSARAVLARPSKDTKSNGSLHTALDSYIRFCAKKLEGRLSATAVKNETERVKEHVEDMPLASFGLTEIDNLIDYWVKRPLSKRGKKPITVWTVKSQLKRIRHFLKWLHRSPEFAWRLPADYAVEPVKIVSTPAETAARLQASAKKVYTLPELETLWQFGTPFQRLLMLFGLNCGFGASEIASLQQISISLREPHGHYDITGSFVKMIRPKNAVYGEWKLWPETVAAIEWYLQNDRPVSSDSSLIVSLDGKPLTTLTKGEFGNRNALIPNQWDILYRRIRTHNPAFRKLSFNKLRKTHASLMRKMGGGELAGISICHGTPVPTDNLLDLYATRPFDLVFAAQEKVGTALRPLFSAEPPPVKTRKTLTRTRLPAATVEAIKALLAEGVKPREIASRLGIRRSTVYWYVEKDPGFSEPT